MRGPSVQRLAALGMLLAVTTTACQWRYVGGSTIAESCEEGSYRLTGVTLSEPLQSVLGPITVTDPRGSVSITLEDGGWSATADGAVSVEGETLFGHLSGDAFLAGQASGGYTVDANRISFTLSSISGSVRFVGTVGTYTIDKGVSLSDSGLRPLLALLPDANFTCDSPSLTMTFLGAGLTLTFSEL